MPGKIWGAVLDPNELRDFAVDWSPQLDGEKTITASEWTIEEGDVEIDSESFSGTGTIVRLTGGTLDTSASLLNRVTLSDGEIYEQTCIVRIQAR